MKSALKNAESCIYSLIHFLPLALHVEKASCWENGHRRKINVLKSSSKLAVCGYIISHMQQASQSRLGNSFFK